MLAEIRRVLKPGGEVVLSDVAAPDYWQHRCGRAVGKLMALTYFGLHGDFARGRVEADAVAHMYTRKAWSNMLREAGFTQIQVTNLPSRRLMPQPLIVKAVLE